MLQGFSFLINDPIHVTSCNHKGSVVFEVPFAKFTCEVHVILKPLLSANHNGFLALPPSLW